MKNSLNVLDVGAGDPDLVSDPWDISEAIPDALAELMEATGLGKPTEVRDSFDR